jgi:hypothetical protein
MDLFRQQDFFSSEIVLNMLFTNPDTNFIDDISDYDQSFHFSTYDFDISDYPNLEATEFSDAAIDVFKTSVLTDID